MMFLEMASYVGDVLSFYTDTQISETFLTLAQDKENIYNMAYAMGYKPKLSSCANVNLSLSQLVPSKVVNSTYVPDYEYALNVKENSTFISNEGPNFYLTENCNFNFSSSFSPLTTSIYQYDGSGNPEYYLLEKKGKAISGNSVKVTKSIGSPEKYKSIKLLDTNIIKIESITDSDGNEWTEVPYLAQDTVFEEVTNVLFKNYQHNPNKGCKLPS
jgi:hypothetical protein